MTFWKANECIVHRTVGALVLKYYYHTNDVGLQMV